MSFDRSEKIGLTAAAAGHVILFVMLSLRFGQEEPLAPPPPPVSVSLVGETSMRSTAPAPAVEPAPSVAPQQGEPTEAPAEAETPPAPVEQPSPPPPQVERRPDPAPPKPAPVKKEAPAPRPEKKEAVRPEPKKAEPKKAEPKPAETKKAEPKKAEPKKEAAKPAPVKKESSSEGKAESKPTAPAKTATTEPARGSQLGKDFLKGISDSGEGKVAAPPAATIGPEVSRSLSQQITRELKPHWRVPAGVDTDQLVTILSWNMDSSGRVVGRPRVVRQTGINASNKPQAALHAENAIAAVLRASPFDLPEKYYSVWKSVDEFEFNRKLAQ